ncbi:MAG: hypothetical protein ABJF10_19805 [Chthoniobacter sp.]
MLLLAENIDAGLGWIFGAVFTFLVMGFLSFWPATRGHWSALLLAGPSVIFGGFLIWYVVANSHPNQPMPDLWFFFPAPFAIGLASIVFWASARHADRAQDSEDDETP